MDSLDNLLPSLLGTLQLQPKSPSPSTSSPSKFDTFTCFPDLPIELRLKIFKHALPPFTVLHLTAEVLLADPDFGLYLTFSIAPPPSSAQISPFDYPRVELPRKWYREERRLHLRRVNKECQGVYQETFCNTLPSGEQRKRREGKIRFSPHEAIHLRKFDELIKGYDLVRALDQDWRLQGSFNEVEILVFSVWFFFPVSERSTERRVKILRRFGRLKVVKSVMWAGLRDATEAVANDMRGGVRTNIDIVEKRLRMWKEESDDSYIVPRFEIIDQISE